jgi:hypothetical protein
VDGVPVHGQGRSRDCATRLPTTLPIGEIYGQRARPLPPVGLLEGRVCLCAIGVPPATPSVSKVDLERAEDLMRASGASGIIAAGRGSQPTTRR